jgi:SAM-dependent methyltransferase
MQLYIGGLSDNTTEDEVVALFSKIGTVESVRVIRDIGSGKSRGFAIVRMSNNTEGEEAIKKLNGAMLANRPVAVGRMHETLPGEMEFREWLRDNTREVLERIGVGHAQTVLDFGCGPGVFSIASASIVGHRGKVYALDVRSKALEHLREAASRKGLDNIETMLLDRSTVSIALENESVDVVLLYDVLQEIPDKTGLVKELYRILRQDGLLSVFPMHLGTDKFLNMINALGLFQFKERYGPPGFPSASEVINLTKLVR